MTRAHAARQLLALGPLSFGQFAQITGWPVIVCRRVLSYLVDVRGEATRYGRLYRLTNATCLPDVHPLEAEGKPAYGETPHGALRTGGAMGVLPAPENVYKIQACSGRRGSRPAGVGEGVLK